MWLTNPDFGRQEQLGQFLKSTSHNLRWAGAASTCQSDAEVKESLAVVQSRNIVSRSCFHGTYSGLW